MRLLQNLQVCVEHLIYNNNFSCILPNSNSNTGGAGGKLISNNKADNIFRKPIDLWGFEGAAAVKPGNPSSLSPLSFPLPLPSPLLWDLRGGEMDGRREGRERRSAPRR